MRRNSDKWGPDRLEPAGVVDYSTREQSRRVAIHD
jgi:hypothetical protein